MISFVNNEVAFTAQLGVLICTRNRPEYLENLLKSISDSYTKPKEIVLVSSGITVDEVVLKFTETLNITHVHTDKSGQSNQKIIGFNSFKTQIDWVFFLDDDLLLMPDTIYKSMQVISKIGDRNIGGIGTKIVSVDHKPISKKFDWNPIVKNKIGKIQNSGRATNYMFNDRVETEWLNGVSIWRQKYLAMYNLPILDSRYAAYEDVNFSSKVAKHATLIFEPSLEVCEQVNHSQPVTNLSHFKYITLWSGYLVCNLESTNLLSYKLLTFFRWIIFLKNISRSKQRTLASFLILNAFVFRVFKLPNNKRRASRAIIELIAKENS
jgi:glycosyltransferase involved in cell wall biosynthesis